MRRLKNPIFWGLSRLEPSVSTDYTDDADSRRWSRCNLWLKAETSSARTCDLRELISWRSSANAFAPWSRKDAQTCKQRVGAIAITARHLHEGCLPGERV